MKNIQSMESEYRKTQIAGEFKEQVRLDVSFKIPIAHYELWLGIMRKRGLDDGFLEFMIGRMMTHTIYSIMETETFAE